MPKALVGHHEVVSAKRDVEIPRKRLRILSLSSEYPNPLEPGKGLFVYARLQGLATSADLTVFAPVALLDYANPDGKLLASLKIPSSRRDNLTEIRHLRWLYPPKAGWLNAFFLFFRLLGPVAKLHWKSGIDVIDAHFAHPEGIAAALLSRTLGIPFMVTMRGSELRYRQQRFKRFWMGWALRRANRVVAVSEGLRSLAIDLGVSPMAAKLIPNGINCEIFFRRDPLECRRKHQISEHALLILAAGDLAHLKGHHRIIEAVRRLSASGLPVQLLIAGGVGRSGQYAATLRAQIAEHGLAERVRFFGLATQTVLAELMSAADVFCLGSSTEGWPNVVNEALACGTPVVATDVGAVRQMLPTPDLGTIVQVEDADGLAAALRDALTRNWEHDAISKWGRSRSWENVADEVLDAAAEAAVRA